jgi:hypothetical protein
MNRRFGVAVVLGTFVICRPGFAAQDWPDSVDQYVAQVRKTIDTIDFDGYLTVVKNPNGALLLDVGDENELVSGHVPVGAVLDSFEPLVPRCVAALIPDTTPARSPQCTARVAL